MMINDAQLDAIKARIDEIFFRFDKGDGGHNIELVHHNLASAYDCLQKARQAHSQKNHDAAAVYHSKEALLYLNLAILHENGRESKKTVPASRVHRYIDLLGSGIVQFKTVIEWKNCQLGESVRQWFIECAELHEDALNQLRFGNEQAAEFAALGGLLLQDHVYLKAELEHSGQLCLRSQRHQIKLSGNAAQIAALTQHLNQARQSTLLRTENLPAKVGHQILETCEAAEKALIESIAAFADDNKTSLKKCISQTQTLTAKLDQLLIEAAQLRYYDDREEGTQSALSIEEKEMLIDPQAFETQANILHNVLKERVDDPELVRLRTLSIIRAFNELHKSYQKKDQSRVMKYLTATRTELTKLRLLLSQAELFKG